MILEQMDGTPFIASAIRNADFDKKNKSHATKRVDQLFRIS